MSVRSWVSDQLHDLIGFTNPAIIDYLIAQAAEPAATSQSLASFVLDSTTPDKQPHVNSFAEALLQRVAKKSSGGGDAAGAQQRREEERKKALLRKNASYELIDSTEAEEEEEEAHRRRLLAAKEKEKQLREQDKVKRRERKSPSNDDDGDGRTKSDSSATQPAGSDERMVSEDEAEKEAALLARMTDAEKAEYRKRKDIEERDAYIRRLESRDSAKTKHLAGSPSSASSPSIDKPVAEMTREEMQTLLPQLRLKAREHYLTRREAQQLELLRLTLQDEAFLFSSTELTAREKRELEKKQQLLSLAQQRKALTAHVDAYHMPDSYTKPDGSLDINKRKALLDARYVEEGKKEHEQDGWEREQKRKSDLTTGSLDRKAADYAYVFDSAIDFIKAELIAGTDVLPPPAPVKEEKLSPHEAIQHARKQLPIFPYRSDLLSAISQYQILIIVGETGSGKTTQIMQYLYEEGYAKQGMIGCTQPRRVAAMSVAARVANEMNVKLGHEVGYTIRFEDCTSERTKIKYMTDGMLLREFLTSPLLSQYSVLMIDEAHERTLSTDILFALIKDIALERTDLKILISSATLDAEKFSQYFNHAPIFIIPGRRYPVDIYYTKQPEADYIDAAVATVVQIHTTQPKGDMLVFLTGQEEIEGMTEQLLQRVKQFPKHLLELIVLPIYSSLPSDQQAKIFIPTPSNARKVILSTNIAETSLTIDGIIYVIDCGLTKLNSFHPRTGMESLVVTAVSKASANQRAGRAGRVAAGKCFRLYTKAAYADLDDNTVPEIQRTNLAHVVLQLKALGIDDILHFDYIDPPPSETLIAAFTQLYALGALNDEGKLTKLGRRMAELPLDPQLSKALIHSESYHCTQQVLIIIAMLGVQGSILYEPKDKKVIARTAHKYMQHPKSDHLTLLNLYHQWEANAYSPDWCYDHFVQLRSMKRAQDIHTQLITLLPRIELTLSSTDDDHAILKALLSGFFGHIARLDRTGAYKTWKSKQTVHLHPTSVLYREDGSREDGCVMYHELMLTKKEFMRVCSVVELDWLSEIAPHMYKKKEMEELSAKRKMPKQRKAAQQQNEQAQVQRT